MELLIENALNIGADEFYRSSRYALPLVVMLVNSADKNAFNILEESVRQTDIIQQLDSNTIIIFLSHAGVNESNHCIEKFKERLEFTYTLREFKGSQSKFLEALFLENSKKL